jgi:hypothetical protein
MPAAAIGSSIDVSSSPAATQLSAVGDGTVVVVVVDDVVVEVSAGEIGTVVVVVVEAVVEGTAARVVVVADCPPKNANDQKAATATSRAIGRSHTALLFGGSGGSDQPSIPSSPVS